MSIFDIFKKSNQKDIQVIAPKEQTTKNHRPTISLHEDLEGLVWIGDGKYKNYSREIKHQSNFEVEGIKFTYSFLGADEPSVVYTEQNISIPENESLVERPSYYPNYSDLSPEQKWIYLKLLSNPYDTSINIGYVFILYYGLERHLLCGEFEKAFKVILKLRDVHANKSFQAYSSNALILTSMLHKRGEMVLEFMNSIDKDYELTAISDNLYLICCYSFNIPLLPKDITRMAKTFEFKNNNYIKKYPEIFEQCLIDVMMEKLKTNQVDLNNYITKTELKKIRTESASIFANTSINEKTFPVPIFSDNFKLKKEMNILLETAHENVKQKLTAMKKSGIDIPVSVSPKKKEKVLVFNIDQEKELIKELENNQSSPFARHFIYIQLQDFYYQYRELNLEYLNKCVECCFLDINSLDEMQKDFLEKEAEKIKRMSRFQDEGFEQKEMERIRKEGFIGNIPAFNRLAIIFEKQGNFTKAIEICDSAIAYGQSVDSFKERKDKLLKKLNAK